MFRGPVIRRKRQMTTTAALVSGAAEAAAALIQRIGGEVQTRRQLLTRWRGQEAVKRDGKRSRKRMRKIMTKVTTIIVRLRTRKFQQRTRRILEDPERIKKRHQRTCATKIERKRILFLHICISALVFLPIIIHLFYYIRGPFVQLDFEL